MTGTTTLSASTGLQIGQDPSPAEIMALARRIRADDDLALHPVRLGVLSSFTFDFADAALVVEGARQGLRIHTHFGAFGQFEQEVYEGSRLQSFGPDALLIAMRPEDVDPDAVTRYHATGGARFAGLMAELGDRVENLVRTFRGWSRAPVLVANYTPPPRLPLGIYDANLDRSLTYELGIANAELRQRVYGCPGAVVWDYAGLVRATGSAEWTDPRLWAMARVPVAPRHQPALARHLVRTLLAVRREPAKCLVLDLDNTLWGGVIGDDGPGGIRLGDDFPGNVFKDFQRSVLALMDRGILLAISSKNDPDVVDAVLRDHPEMLIRPEHIAASRIGWFPKSRGLREIADELGIGVDTLVLFDDNPVERAEVRANAPEVAVVDVPGDPLRYSDALWDCGFFDQVALSQEDLGRTRMYRAERERRVLAARFDTVDDYLASLDMVAEVGDADDLTLGRVTQLINKTNQFNLTSRRRTLADMEDLVRDPGHHVFWVRVRDRFGDQGIIAVAILRLDHDAAVIDTLLMSCRMMNRRVEDAVLAELVRRARDAGLTRLIGEYIATARNTPVSDLYTRFGFAPLDGAGPDGTRFALDLDGADVAWPGVVGRAASP